MREEPLQPRQRIDRIAGANAAFDIGGHQPPARNTINTRPHPRQPLRQRGHARYRLERIARRDKEPYLIQPQLPQRPAGQLHMSLMNGVERATKQAHAHASAIAMRRYQQDQARTCPVPITS